MSPELKYHENSNIKKKKKLNFTKTDMSSQLNITKTEMSPMITKKKEEKLKLQKNKEKNIGKKVKHEKS